MRSVPAFRRRARADRPRRASSMARMGWNEAELLRWLARRARPRALLGSQGHDAAVLRRLRGLPVVCADQVDRKSVV